MGHKLYKSNKILHLTFLIYRLKRDFGYTLIELANLTGIPPYELEYFYRKYKKTLFDEVRKIISSMDFDKELEAWYLIPDGKHKGLGQGYRHSSKNLPEWLKKMNRHKNWSTKPEFVFGFGGEKEWLRTHE